MRVPRLPVNQILPPGPWGKPCGTELRVGIGNSETFLDEMSIIPIWWAAFSVNHIVFLGPAAMSKGTAPAVRPPYSVISCVAGLITPILLAAISVNQRL